MDFVNKAINAVTPSKTTEEKLKVEPPKVTTTTTPSATGIVEKTKETAGVGVSKVAGATADTIGAGKDYAKLDTSQGVGKQVQQAETFARSYETPAPGTVGSAVKAAEDVFKK